MELEDGTELSKHGTTMHCSICNSENHTKRNHSRCTEENQHAMQQNVEVHDGEADPTVLQVKLISQISKSYYLSCQINMIFNNCRT